MMVMMIFMIVGAIDRMLGNKFGYGEEFEKGFSAMGPLALAMAGVIAAAPLLAQMLGPIISPIYAFMELTQQCLRQQLSEPMSAVML